MISTTKQILLPETPPPNLWAALPPTSIPKSLVINWLTKLGVLEAGVPPGPSLLGSSTDGCPPSVGYGGSSVSGNEEPMKPFKALPTESGLPGDNQ